MSKTKLALGLSVLCGGLSVGAFHLYLQKLEQQVSGGPKVSILAAAKELPVGSTLGAEHLAEQLVPSQYVTRRHVRAKDADKLLGVRTTSLLKAGDALQWQDVASGHAPDRSLAALVQSGMRALNITSEQLFDGLLRPGDRVDVLFTDSGQTSTLLQGILVLAVNGTTVVDAQSAGGRRSASVVLSVTAEQAQTITLAEQHGKLRLVLRNAEDLALLEQLPPSTRAAVSSSKEPGEARVASLAPKPHAPVIGRVRTAQ
jgi:pilus assembly protein CpaB